ncbi:hypothetical protein [Qipengyuania thermophila]|uniref:hypothetical protein n=1 Tax=Qipengyuania thermophila TaxID=2509361 RepID=UPI001F2D207F|nr:hypothetical protein [Qipengyuania thermophila]
MKPVFGPGRVLALLCAAALSGCVSASAGRHAAQDAFFAALSSHCGRAYAGALVSSDAADAAMAGRAMQMHVRDCTGTRVAIAFHIETADGVWDRSRTWLVSRVEEGLLLQHDHRHADGSADAVTLYGGRTTGPGTPRAQEFPVDPFSIALFRANGLEASVTNVWRVEVDPRGVPGGRYAYQLRREGRLFRVEFDTTRPIPVPPPAWGWT